MGIASLVIGIFAACLAFVPVINYLAILPAFIGLGLGIAETILAKKNANPNRLSKTNSFSIAGIVLNSFAFVNILTWSLLLSLGFSSIQDNFKKKFGWDPQNHSQRDFSDDSKSNDGNFFRFERKFRFKQYPNDDSGDSDDSLLNRRLHKKFNGKSPAELIERFQQQFRKNFKDFEDFDQPFHYSRKKYKKEKEKPKKEFEKKYKSVI